MGFFFWGEANKTHQSHDWWHTAGVRDYFPIRRLPRTPRVDRRYWSERSWRQAPIEPVPLDQVHATQDWISTAGLRHHTRPGARAEGGTWPWVVDYQGRYYLIDGHHRAICALQRGERHIRAHVKRPEQDPR